MKCHSWCILLILLCGIYGHSVVVGTNGEDSWIEPNAWGREQRLQNEQPLGDNVPGENSKTTMWNWVCSGDNHGGDAVALIYYKKLIAYLFKSDMLKYNEVTGEYRRALLLTALPNQLEQLEILNDPRDLDGVLMEILLQTRTLNKFDYYDFAEADPDAAEGMGVGAPIWDVMKTLAQLLKTSEVKFLLGVACLILLGWYCHRRYHIGIITMIIAAVVCFSYFHTYLECNRRLEAERLQEFLLRNEQKKESSQIREPIWYSAVVNFFTSNEQTASQSNQEYIKKASELHLPFCRPDHVLIIYANDLFLKQLELLLDKCVTTMLTLRGNLSFPFNYIAAFLLVALIAYIVKLTFKYILSPRAWVGLWQSHAMGTQERLRQPQPLSSGTTHHKDRMIVSGENLRMLLNAISGGKAMDQVTTSDKTASPLTQPRLQASGVQEISEMIEAANHESASEPSKSDTAEVIMEREPDNNNGSTTEHKDYDKLKNEVEKDNYEVA